MTVSICHDESWSLVFSPLSTPTNVAPNPTKPLSPNRENAAAAEAEEQWAELLASERTLCRLPTSWNCTSKQVGGGALKCKRGTCHIPTYQYCASKSPASCMSIEKLHLSHLKK